VTSRLGTGKNRQPFSRLLRSPGRIVVASAPVAAAAAVEAAAAVAVAAAADTALDVTGRSSFAGVAAVATVAIAAFATPISSFLARG
jgi:hypothetical protein